jgi:3-dehydroquinate synthase
MSYIQQEFSVRFSYNVFFTEHLFDTGNDVFRSFLAAASREAPQKILFVIDDGVANSHPYLQQAIHGYFKKLDAVQVVDEILVIPGGESAKNSDALFQNLIAAVDKYKIDRHSYIAAIGGGSVLDLVGYAAAVAHRGIRHIRIPTTVLSQNDSGVGVKNGINYNGKKNFLGTFAPPVAVFNDAFFLTTLSDAEWRNGISEAIKVALIKDAAFFYWLEANTKLLAARNGAAMQYLIKRCAELHLQHIAGGDPFETGSSRPLDFGHWSAHKLEQLSGFEIRHGEAVALGIAQDSVYSCLSGRLDEQSTLRILILLQAVGFDLTNPLLEIKDEQSPILAGLQEFREHLGGQLTIMLLQSIGTGEEVHEIDTALLRQVTPWIRQHFKNPML